MAIVELRFMKSGRSLALRPDFFPAGLSPKYAVPPASALAASSYVVPADELSAPVQTQIPESQSFNSFIIPDEELAPFHPQADAARGTSPRGFVIPNTELAPFSDKAKTSWLTEEAAGPLAIVDPVLAPAAGTSTNTSKAGTDGPANEQDEENAEPADETPTAPPDSASTTLGLPSCGCQGRKGKGDAFQNGADPNTSELCAGPWGGHVQYCHPVPKDGKCWGTEKKCTTSHGDAREISAAAAQHGPCLCGFDIDRTLTARQGSARSGRGGCPNTTKINHGYDSAFGGGALTFGAAAASGIKNTACAQCYVGIVSQGAATGSTKLFRQALVDAITTPVFAEIAAKHPDAHHWSYGGFTRRGQRPVVSPLIIRQPNMKKQHAVEGILQWYASKGVVIPRERVFFFDDRADNAEYFAGTGMNAHQIGCASRQANVAYCGATVAEISLTPGVAVCPRVPHKPANHSSPHPTHRR